MTLGELREHERLARTRAFEVADDPAASETDRMTAVVAWVSALSDCYDALRAEADHGDG